MENGSTIVYQLARNLSIDEIKKSGYDTYFADRFCNIDYNKRNNNKLSIIAWRK